MRARGFTLIEMIISITLLGIVGLFIGEVIRQSLVLYSDVEARSSLTQQGRFVTERLRRELREAVPNSVVSNTTGRCIEFFPIVNSGIYMELPTAAASSSFRALPFLESGVDGDRVTIYPASNVQLRGAINTANGQVAILGSDVNFTPSSTATMIDLQLEQAVQFGNSSPANRFYIYSEPVAFCLVGNELLRYTGYALNRNLEPGDATLGTGVLIVDNVLNATFAVEQAQLQRNGLVKLEVTLTDNGESIRFDDDALIYNTP